MRVSVEHLKNMGLKKSFLLLSLFCLIAAFLLLGISILVCRGIMASYPSGGVEILSDGSVIPLPEPTAVQQRVLTVLNIIQMACCIIFPVGGLLTSVALFYHIKLYGLPIKAHFNPLLMTSTGNSKSTNWTPVTIWSI